MKAVTFISVFFKSENKVITTVIIIIIILKALNLSIFLILRTFIKIICYESEIRKRRHFRADAAKRGSWL